MDPISLAIGAVGLGMQIFGGMGQAKDASRAAKISQDEARQEQGINDQKQQAMELSARRQQMEISRNAQRQRALATNSAVNQGAQFGSGLQGGLAEVTDQSLFNAVGVDSALETGRNINKYNSNISADKIAMADVQASSAQNAGFASLGGSLMKAGPIIGQLSGGFGKSNSFGSLFGGGSPSGYGA